MEFLPFILMIVITMAAWYFIMARQGGGNSKVMNFGKSRARMSDNRYTYSSRMWPVPRRRRKSFRKWSIS